MTWHIHILYVSFIISIFIFLISKVYQDMMHIAKSSRQVEIFINCPFHTKFVMFWQHLPFFSCCSCFPHFLCFCLFVWARPPGGVITHSSAHLIWIQQSAKSSIYTRAVTPLCQVFPVTFMVFIAWPTCLLKRLALFCFFGYCFLGQLVWLSFFWLSMAQVCHAKLHWLTETPFTSSKEHRCFDAF